MKSKYVSPETIVMKIESYGLMEEDSFHRTVKPEDGESTDIPDDGDTETGGPSAKENAVYDLWD